MQFDIANVNLSPKWGLGGSSDAYGIMDNKNLRRRYVYIDEVVGITLLGCCVCAMRRMKFLFYISSAFQGIGTLDGAHIHSLE